VRTTVSAALVALAASAALAGAPQQRVRETVDSVSAIVNDARLQGSGNERERRDRVARVMHESFDFPAMAQDSLGTHWASLTPDQRDRFLGGSDTTYGAESVDGERATVKTTLLRKGGDQLPVDYRLIADHGAWKISDVIVDGVSLAGNFRSQFTKTIQDSSYDALVQRIEKKLAEDQ